jgi:uncharacterized lipoprotein
MRNRMNRLLIVVSGLLPLAGCGLLPDAYSGCDKIQPYQAAQQMPRLEVPAGADLPETRNALKIPEIRTPQVPAEPGKCLEHPPSYGSARPRAG